MNDITVEDLQEILDMDLTILDFIAILQERDTDIIVVRPGKRSPADGDCVIHLQTYDDMDDDDALVTNAYIE